MPAKLIIDATLYVISFQVQRRFVFAKAPVTPRAGERVRLSSLQP